MKSTISFTATVAFDAGGTIAVQAEDVPIAVPDPPAIPDLGPIERRPFDPDRVRQQQANAL